MTRKLRLVLHLAVTHAIATELASDGAAASGRDQARLQALAETVKGIAQSLR